MENRLKNVAICSLLFIVTGILAIWVIVSESVIVRFLMTFVLLIVWTLFVLCIVKLAFREDEDEDK